MIVLLLFIHRVSITIFKMLIEFCSSSCSYSFLMKFTQQSGYSLLLSISLRNPAGAFTTPHLVYKNDREVSIWNFLIFESSKIPILLRIRTLEFHRKSHESK